MARWPADLFEPSVILTTFKKQSNNNNNENNNNINKNKVQFNAKDLNFLKSDFVFADWQMFVSMIFVEAACFGSWCSRLLRLYCFMFAQHHK